MNILAKLRDHKAKVNRLLQEMKQLEENGDEADDPIRQWNTACNQLGEFLKDNRSEILQETRNEKIDCILN